MMTYWWRHHRYPNISVVFDPVGDLPVQLSLRPADYLVEDETGLRCLGTKMQKNTVSIRILTREERKKYSFVCQCDSSLSLSSVLRYSSSYSSCHWWRGIGCAMDAEVLHRFRSRQQASRILTRFQLHWSKISAGNTKEADGKATVSHNGVVGTGEWRSSARNCFHATQSTTGGSRSIARRWKACLGNRSGIQTCEGNADQDNKEQGLLDSDFTFLWVRCRVKVT